ncbi:hypothetical protein [Mycolicibacterium llatzerense]|uniref:hypothetical protein n=1 Tax=Mycolicibacterium llatzerense TaxID=280871 RepID=UPI0021B663A3|nr:hypothetical protein [Mycolicibacterium llatzerense]MCT7366512.1 hypothetical protein [Mycolicibacterium llatzerense]
MTEEAPDWVSSTPGAPVHNLPTKQDLTFPFTPQQLLEIGGQLIEQFLRRVVEAVVGFFVPGAGPAFDQLFDWAHDLGTAAWGAFNQVGQLISDIGGHVIGDVSAALNGAVNGLASLVNNLLHNAGAVIGSIPQTIVTGLNGALSALTSGVAAATQFVQQVIDAIMSALRGIPIVGGLIPDLNKAVKSNKVDQQNFTISAIVSDVRTPSWAGRYAISDVTYPEFINNKLAVFGQTDGASTGTAHTHTIGNANSAEAEAAGWLVNQNESRGSYLPVTNTTVFDTFGLVAWKVSGTLNNVYAEIFKVNDDGSLPTRIFSQEFSSSITTTTGYFEFTLPSRLIVQSGERYLCRLRNSSSVATGVWLIGMELVTSAAPNGFKTVGATDTNKTSYTASEAATAQAAGNTLNWFMLAAKNMPSVDKSYSDDFNRLNIGGLWVRASSTASLPDIYEEALGYTGSSDGDQEALYIRPCSRDVNRVEANLHINMASTARCGVLLHCSRDFAQVVYLGVNGTSAKIYSGPIASLSERASLSSGGTARWALYYDESADKYVALKDGANTGLQWTSVGSTVLHGSDYRYGGTRISLASGEAAGTIDDWVLRDWYIAVPATVQATAAVASIAAGSPSVTAGATVAHPAATASATGGTPTVTAGAVAATAPASATATAGDAAVSNNTGFPYTFPFNLS